MLFTGYTNKIKIDPLRYNNYYNLYTTSLNTGDISAKTFPSTYGFFPKKKKKNTTR